MSMSSASLHLLVSHWQPVAKNYNSTFPISGNPFYGSIKFIPDNGYDVNSSGFNNGTLYFFDGYDWKPMMHTESHTTLSLDQESDDAINWAIQKMRQEKELLELLEENEGLKDLYQQFQFMLKLVQDHKKSGQ